MQEMRKETQGIVRKVVSEMAEIIQFSTFEVDPDMTQEEKDTLVENIMQTVYGDDKNKAYLLMSDVDNGAGGYEIICGLYTTKEKAEEAAKTWIPERKVNQVITEMDVDPNDVPYYLENKVIRTFEERVQHSDYRPSYYFHYLYVKEMELQ